MNKRWKKRLKKLFTSFEFYLTSSMLSLALGLFASVFTQILFTLIFKFNWLTVEIFTMGIITTLVAGAFVADEMFFRYSDFDDEIIEEEEKEKEEEKQLQKQALEQRYKHINNLKKSIYDLDETGENNDIKVLLQSFYDTIQIVSGKKGTEVKERHYVENTLPKDIVNTLMIYQELTPENQAEMKPKLMNTFQKKYDELEIRFIHNEQEKIKNEMNRQIELLNAREY